MTHKSISVVATSKKGESALKKQYKGFKGSDNREKLLGRGMGVSVELLSENPRAIKIHFRGVAGKIVKMEHALLEIATHMKEADCRPTEDYVTEVEE